MRLGLAAAAVALLPGRASAAPIRWISSAGSGDAPKYGIPVEDGVHVDRGNEVILVRYEGTISAYALSCPHQRSLLRWREKDGMFQCTKHHSQYSPTGEYLKGRATRNMDRLAIQVVDGEVEVDPSQVFHSDDDPTGWAAAVVTVPGT